MNFSFGTMLGRYRIEEKLGQGQAGVVYRAFDTAIERIVAIKCLRSGLSKLAPESAGPPLGDHLEEAKVIGSLHHPHITAVFDMGDSGGVSYIVMEYVQGQTLRARQDQTPTDPASVPQILNYIVMVARALHYVHQHGILHGDIKPANLFVTPQGTPKIMDFGVARRSAKNQPASWSLAGVNQIGGTPGYVAPEALVANKIDTRADVFSLAVVAYEWLAGRKPFAGHTAEAMVQAVLHSQPPLLSEVGDFDSELSAALNLALARDPAQRLGSADALADALEICQERWSKQAPPAGSPGSSPVGTFPRLPSRNLLFADFNEADLAAVMQMSRQETYQTGEAILQEGSGGSTMYLVVRGRASIRKLSGEQQVEIKQVSAGECFGEMAVISQMPRSATVVALQPTEVIAISGAVLRSANQALCMKLYRNITALLTERLRQRDEQVVGLLENDPKTSPAKRKRFFPFW